jgi:hypothetical protein
MSAPFEPKKFAILRVAKIKDVAGLAAHSNHVTRAVPTANADPDMPPPKTLVGSGNPRADVLDALATVPGKRRKNATIAVEIFLGASPDWLRNGGPPGSFDTHRTALLASAAKMWFTDQFGPNGVSLVMHLDESTPHFHATFCPIDDTPSATGKATGRRLNAGRWFDGPEKLAQLQDSWAAATADLGLERGVKGSKARHQDVRRLYGSIEADAAKSAVSAVRLIAFEAGVNAYATGIIETAGETSNGRHYLAMSKTATPEEKAAVQTAIKPAFADVWHWVSRQSVLVAQRIAKEAAEALGTLRTRFRDAEALVERAHALRSHLDAATRAEAVLVAAALQRAPRRSPALKSRAGEAR